MQKKVEKLVSVTSQLMTINVYLFGYKVFFFSLQLIFDFDNILLLLIKSFLNENHLTDQAYAKNWFEYASVCLSTSVGILNSYRVD